MKKVITITGAGGTVGLILIEHFLKKNIEIRAIERSEIAMANLIDISKNNDNLKIFLIDLIDDRYLGTVIRGSDVIIHCAALKHVSVGANFPEELAIQNVVSFSNIVKLAKKYKIKKTLLCSTDKAATPTSVMGASKLLLEKIVCFSSNEKASFAAVRFGNILNSSGSVIPKITSRLYKGNQIEITDFRMTRYVLLDNDVIKLIEYALMKMKGGEIFIPNVSSIKISDLIDTIVEIFCIKNNLSKKEIKIIEGKNLHKENLHEKMINCDEIKFLYKSESYFILDINKRGYKEKFNYSSLLGSDNFNISKEKIEKMLINLKII